MKKAWNSGSKPFPIYAFLHRRLSAGNRQMEEGRSTSGRMPFQSASVNADPLEHAEMQAVFVPIFSALFEREFVIKALRTRVLRRDTRA